MVRVKKKSQKTDEKSVEISIKQMKGTLGALGALLGHSWGALGALLGRSWGRFGRGFVLLGASFGAGGLRKASGSDLGAILGGSWTSREVKKP